MRASAHTGVAIRSPRSGRGTGANLPAKAHQSSRPFRRGRRPRRPVPGCLPEPGAMWASRPTGMNRRRGRRPRRPLRKKGNRRTNPRRRRTVSNPCHPERSEAESKDPGTDVSKNRQPPVFNNLRSFQQPRAAFWLAVRMDVFLDLRVFLRLDLDLGCVCVWGCGCVCIWYTFVCVRMHLHPSYFKY